MGAFLSRYEPGRRGERRDLILVSGRFRRIGKFRRIGRVRRIEPEGRRIDTISEPGGERTILEYVPQVGIANVAYDFGPDHGEAEVFFLANRF